MKRLTEIKTRCTDDYYHRTSDGQWNESDDSSIMDVMGQMYDVTASANLMVEYKALKVHITLFQLPFADFISG